MTERALRSAGFRVYCAENGLEALEVFDRVAESIDIMVTDVIMPEMSGPQLVASLEARARGMQVLYISGYTDDALSHHGVLNAGVQLLAKSFSSSEIIKKIREMIGAPAHAANQEAKGMPRQPNDLWLLRRVLRWRRQNWPPRG